MRLSASPPISDWLLAFVQLPRVLALRRWQDAAPIVGPTPALRF